MAYKKIENYISFADIAINTNADKNRSLLFLSKLDNSIDWTPMDRPFPDHSTFSRFRKRFSKDAMIKINSELLWADRL